ncbi:hypothetical protein T12_16652 [Trichinella patagoniensis]|uniref:Uncharacterized protein n=1 Tax=Trichinella patagoniensis TaxID=990121 RepID=A0A0V0ZH84_9BILA|nr:hypothetical protein T12_16652 [Trichinella patagoniensis]
MHIQKKWTRGVSEFQSRFFESVRQFSQKKPIRYERIRMVELSIEKGVDGEEQNEKIAISVCMSSSSSSRRRELGKVKMKSQSALYKLCGANDDDKEGGASSNGRRPFVQSHEGDTTPTDRPTRRRL